MSLRVVVPVLLAAVVFGCTPPNRAPLERITIDADTLPTLRDLNGRPIVLTPTPGENLDVIDDAIRPDSNVEASLPEIDRQAEKKVDAAVNADNVGPPRAAQLGVVFNAANPNRVAPPPLVELPAFIGVLRPNAPKGAPKNKDEGKPFAWRTGEAKAKLVKQHGGNEASERAVAIGLAWLAKQQKQDGGWEYDQGSKEERIAATGMALLPFLGAGETHKDPNGKYKDVINKGLEYLKKSCPPNGPKAGRMTDNMYAQAIGALALCEAYGMTGDAMLRPEAQAAVDYILKSQGPNGSWGYGPGANGDTSIVGWQVQALYAAQTAGLDVSDKALKKAVKFLDLAAGGAQKSMYGYADAAGARPGTSLTAVGLYSRARIDGWGPDHPGIRDGVAGLMKHPPIGKGDLRDMYYYYYATPVLRLAGGDDWAKWNEGPKGADEVRKGGMRDWLVAHQIAKEGANRGSWDPEQGWFGSSCGRLGTTAVCLLTLEVYYRYAPPEKAK